jgi:hypothetical protein
MWIVKRKKEPKKENFYNNKYLVKINAVFLTCLV